MIKIGIIRESRIDDNRTPLVPIHIKKLLKTYTNIKIIVQPSQHRCYKGQEYEKQGALINEDLSECDIILGIKEIEPNVLLESKTYIFFSHTSKIQSDNSAAVQGTPGMDKKKLLREILNKKIKLIDYENIRNNLGRRYLGFGRFAGIVGCYNSLNLYLKSLGKSTMPRVFELNSYNKLKDNIRKKKFSNLKIIVTGDGRVANGTLELLGCTNLKKIDPKNFLINDNNQSYCNLTTQEYMEHKDGRKFDLQNFIKFPNMYNSVLEKYLPYANMLISSHYWDPKSPKLFSKNKIANFKELKIIGDITCDTNGSIPTTCRTSTIKKPYYYIDKIDFKEVKNKENTLAIMAVDNLPSELPKDSSKEFGDGVIKEIFPYLINKDDGRIEKATITNKGSFCPSYNYLNNYINA